MKSYLCFSFTKFLVAVLLIVICGNNAISQTKSEKSAEVKIESANVTPDVSGVLKIISSKTSSGTCTYLYSISEMTPEVLVAIKEARNVHPAFINGFSFKEYFLDEKKGTLKIAIAEGLTNIKDFTNFLNSDINYRLKRF